MPESKRRKTKKRVFFRNLSYKNRKNGLSNSNPQFTTFKRDLTQTFFEILLMIKLYHWKTYSFATHKATDELYDKFNGNMDRFMEVLLGKTSAGGRIQMKSGASISLFDLDDPKELVYKIGQFKSFLINLNVNPGLRVLHMDNSDLFTIRDEILADLNQFLYLLTLHG